MRVSRVAVGPGEGRQLGDDCCITIRFSLTVGRNRVKRDRQILIINRRQI